MTKVFKPPFTQVIGKTAKGEAVTVDVPYYRFFTDIVSRLGGSNTANNDDLEGRLERLEGVSFYTEADDCTDDLEAFLANLLSTHQDVIGEGNPTDYLGPISVDFLGRQYYLSRKITLGPEFCGVELRNFAFIAAPGFTDDCMIEIGAESGGRTVRVGLANYLLQCEKLTSGVHFQTTTQCYSDNGTVLAMTLYGIKADVSNRRIEINGGCLQEFGTNDVVGQTWANRTAVGLWLEKCDGVARSVIMPVNKHGLYINNIRNFAVLQCHPWMGSLLDETERFNAFCVKLGTVDPGADDNGAAGIQFEQCYFDHGPVAMEDSYGHQFVGCTWTGGETGIYPMVLTATAVNETALGLKISNARISKEHNRNFFDFRTSGIGSWNARKQYQITVASAGTAENLPTKIMNGFWVIDEGGNAKPDPAAWDAPTRVQISDDANRIKIAGRPGTFVSHSIYAGQGFMASRWGGGAADPVCFYGALSLSITPGTFGGFPTSGKILARFGGVGDTGTDFGTTSAPGACIDVVTTEDYTLTANGTELALRTTSAGATGDSVVRFRVNETGLIPETDVTYTAGKATRNLLSVYSQTYKVGNSQVVGARMTGWTPLTGTATRTTMATYPATVANAAYQQAQMQALMTAVQNLSERVKALVDDLHATAGHGLIGT